MAAMLMALDDPRVVHLGLAPKPLLQQWQDELMELLDPCHRPAGQAGLGG